MPIYEYKCEKCGHDLEALQQVSEPPLTTCPECGGALRKLLSAPAFQFKGSGWYVTDYARKKDGASAGKEAKESGKEAKSSGKEGGEASPSDEKKEKKAKRAGSSDA